jgi:purine-nucleoside phosphorylase
MGDVRANVDILLDLGANRIIFTNAAGGLQPGLRCGSLLAIDRVATWPCRRWPDAPESLKPTIVIDAEARGAYVWVHGPSYETRTEIAAMRQLGYAAVGMSTAPEMARAHELGIESAAISCITNECGGLEKLTHGQVLATACSATARLVSLLRTAISSFA